MAEEEIPEDDAGVKPQQLIEICDKVIDRCWHEVNGTNEQIPLERLQKVVEVAISAWSLAVNVIMHSEGVTEEDDDGEDKGKEPWQE